MFCNMFHYPPVCMADVATIDVVAIEMLLSFYIDLDGFRLKTKTKSEDKLKEFAHPHFKRDDPNSSCLIQLQVSTELGKDIDLPCSLLESTNSLVKITGTEFKIVGVTSDLI